MRKTKLSFDLFAQQHGNDGLFARFYRHPRSAILLQKQEVIEEYIDEASSTPPTQLTRGDLRKMLDLGQSDTDA